MFIPQKALVLTLSSLIGENFVFSPAKPESKLGEAVASRLQSLCLKEFSLFLLVPQNDPQAACYQQALDNSSISYTVVSYLRDDMAQALKNNTKQFNEDNIYFYDTEPTNVGCVQSVNIANAYFVDSNNTLADSLQMLIDSFSSQEQVDSHDKPAPLTSSVYGVPTPRTFPLALQTYPEPDFSAIPPRAFVSSSSLSFIPLGFPAAGQVDNHDEPAPLTSSVYENYAPSAPPLHLLVSPNSSQQSIGSDNSYRHLPPPVGFTADGFRISDQLAAESQQFKQLQQDIKSQFSQEGGLSVFSSLLQWQPKHLGELCTCRQEDFKGVAIKACQTEPVFGSRSKNLKKLYSIIAYSEWNTVSELREQLVGCELLPASSVSQQVESSASNATLQDNAAHELPSFGQQ